MTLALLLLGAAFASEGPSIVIVRPDTGSWPAAEVRLEAELLALGFHVDRAAGAALDERDRRLELLDLTQAHGAIAGVRILRSLQSINVEIWVTDRQTGKLRSRPLNADADPEAAALHIVDMLRAALVEIGLELPHGRPPPLPLRPRPPEPPPPSRWAFMGGAMLAAAPGGLGPFVGLQLAGSRRLAPSFELELSTSLGTWLEKVEVPEANARVNAGIGRVSALFVAPLATGVVASAGGGVGALGLLAAGSAKPPLIAKTVSAVFAEVNAAARLDVALTEGLALRTAATLDYPFGEASINLARVRGARFRAPLVGLNVGVAATF